MLTKYLVAAFALLFISAATAQNRAEIPQGKLEAVYTRTKDPNISRSEYDRELEKLVDEMMKKLEIWLDQIRKSEIQMRKDLQSNYNYTPGEMNLFPLFEEIPSPIPSLPEAKQVNFEMKYGAYISKVEVQKKQLSEMMQQHLGNQRSSQSQIIYDTKAMANQNAMVQQMGGADALINMSESEQKAMARKMKSSPANNPSAYSGVPDAGMNAMMQKMINDPDYRERYNKMTDAQKQAELQKFMSNQTVDRNDEVFDAERKERNQAQNSLNIQALLGKTLTNMQEAAKPSSEATRITNDFFEEVYANINGWYSKKLALLPEVVMGETTIRQGQGTLDKSRASLIYAFQKKEAATRTIIWADLKTSIKIAFSDFNNFIGNYKWGKTKNASLLDGTYMEPQLASAVSSLYDQMIQFARGAETLTRTHKGQQEQYEIIMHIK